MIRRLITSRHTLFSVALNGVPITRAYTIRTEAIEKDLNQVKKYLGKESLAKKWRKKLESQQTSLEIKLGIKKSQETRENTPQTEREKSKRLQFKEIQYDPAILEYIKKHRLHKIHSGEASIKILPDNTFVASTFNTDNTKVRVCKTEDRYPVYETRHTEIALVGRSNVGKSSIIRALMPRLYKKQAPRISAVPGQTKAIHFIQLSKLTFVDLPGYGFSMAGDTESESWKSFTEHFLASRPILRRVCVLIDARHGFKQADIDFLQLLESLKKKYQIVLTKVDMVEAEDLARRHAQMKQVIEESKLRHCLDRIMMISSFNRAGISNLRKELATLAYSGPQEMPTTPLRLESGRPTRQVFGLNASKQSPRLNINPSGRGRRTQQPQLGRANRRNK